MAVPSCYEKNKNVPLKASNTSFTIAGCLKQETFI
jgi:hypothetical protein